MHIWFSKISPFFFFFHSWIYIKRCDRHNKTHRKTNFLNSLLCFIIVLFLVLPKIKFHISHWSKVVTDSSLTLLLTIKKKSILIKKQLCLSVCLFAHLCILRCFSVSSWNLVGWLGPGVQGSRATSWNDLIKGQRSSRGQVAKEMPYG